MTDQSSPVIIGTGPSGIACAQGLIERGIRPIMIDGGNTARPHGNRSEKRLSAGEKTWFGSSFATDDHPGAPAAYQPSLIARPSYGVGGLSRIWGGTFAFFDDFADWPVDARPQDADLTTVRELVPHSRTDLSESADVGVTAGVIAGSPASARAMRAFNDAAGGGWRAEEATVAIDSRSGSPRRCQLLEACLDGCAADSIWFAGDQLRRWVAEGRVQHLTGSVVERLHETKDGVEITLTDGRTSESIVSRRAYVAAGGIGTGILLVRSGLRREVVLRDTATAFAGILDLRGAARGHRAHHGLSQWWAHRAAGAFLAQVYPPDQSNAGRLAARSALLARRRGLLSAVARRLHPVVAYIGSDASDVLRITTQGGIVHVDADESAACKREMRTQLSAFSRTLMRAGLLLPVPAADLAPAGTGYHFGASLPHGRDTDSLGRPNGLSRIHVVDASVLPSLALGSITPTVMANALRIGRQKPEPADE